MVVATWIFSILIILRFAPKLNSKTISLNCKVIDGNTIHIGSNKIRLHEIDAPETDQTCEIKNIALSYYKKFRKGLTKFINNQKVICNLKGTDQYKRDISICFVNQIDMNEFRH